jgi:hypothetical protein
MRSHLAAFFFLLTCATSAARAGDTPALRVGADPRIELLATVQLLADYGLLTEFDLAYKRQVRAHFKPHTDHRAVTLFAEMTGAGFMFDAPVTTVLHLTDPPALEPIVPIPDSIAARAGGAERLDEFLDALRDFAVDSGFLNFYASQAPFYHAVSGEIVAKLEGISPSTLEDYYGTTQHSYRIIAAPLFHSGGYGPRILHDDGRYDIYSVCGPHGANGDLPDFGKPDRFRDLVWHEFSHSFVNPIVDAHVEQVEKYAALLAPLKRPMAMQAYQQWRPCVYEHIVRAVTARLAFREQGVEDGRKALRYEVSRSFRHVPALAEKLTEYEQQRETYPTFDLFFPQLLEVFAAALDEMPDEAAPKVVHTVPRTALWTADPTITEIRVEFDQDMVQDAGAWPLYSHDQFPETTGPARWNSPRVCVLPVKLDPNRRYWVTISGGEQAFRSVNGQISEEYAIQFETAASAEVARPPKVIRSVPEPGTKDVDPSITELIAEFDKDMRPRGFAWVKDNDKLYPETTGDPFWRTPRICVLPVKLEPGATYWLGLNAGHYRAFRSPEGTPAEEFILEFTTAADGDPGGG